MSNSEDQIDLKDLSVLSEHQTKIVGLGKICHEAIRAFDESMGDFDNLPWQHKSPWYQNVMVECVTFLLKEQRDINQLHVYWCSQMTAHGWVYGLKVDEKTKEHPNLKKFEQISFEEQLKYALLLSIVIAMSPAMVRAASAAMH